MFDFTKQCRIATKVIRQVTSYKKFFKQQPQKVRDKIIQVLDIIEQIDRIPMTYLKYIEGTNK